MLRGTIREAGMAWGVPGIPRVLGCTNKVESIPRWAIAEDDV